MEKECKECKRLRGIITKLYSERLEEIILDCEEDIGLFVILEPMLKKVNIAIEKNRNKQLSGS